MGKMGKIICSVVCWRHVEPPCVAAWQSSEQRDDANACQAVIVANIHHHRHQPSEYPLHAGRVL
jgi:Na+-transporting methylmalonyl-CoA/oxaloacetate decarboxylase gamma subunit